MVCEIKVAGGRRFSGAHDGNHGTVLAILGDKQADGVGNIV
jgi:hypothetical protein